MNLQDFHEPTRTPTKATAREDTITVTARRTITFGCGCIASRDDLILCEGCKGASV